MSKKCYSLHEAYLNVYSEALDSEERRSALAKSARNIQRGPRAAKADVERDMTSSGFKEESEVYDLVLDYLLDEGFCESIENAESVMAHMSEEWIEDILYEWEMKKLSPKERERYAVALRNLADTQEKIRNEKQQRKEEKRKRTTNLANVAMR